MTTRTPSGAARVPRPRIHFTPTRNWMNDPNGLIYHDDRWHMYFQYNPEGNDWGNMSWGHASSRDLQNWTEHQVALEHTHDEQVYSGSIVAAPLGSPDHLRAIYTSAYADGRQAQSEATSTDGGITWSRNPDNPVLDRGTSNFRDPKVIIWTDSSGRKRWVMLAVEAEERRVLFYGSEDLASWEYLSSFGPIGPIGVVWECPDLFSLPVDGDPRQLRWVLTISTNPVGEDPDADGSSMSYIDGNFDGHTFTSSSQTLTRLDYGRDFYAGVTFADTPNGAAIMLGWMSNWRYADRFPTHPWRGAMSLPRELSLRSVRGTPHLIQRPRGIDGTSLDAGPRAETAPEGGTAWQVSAHTLIELAWDPSDTGTTSLALHAADEFVVLTHHADSEHLTITRGGPGADAIHPDFPSTTTLPLSASRPAHLLVCLDGPLLEVFAANGEAVASNLVLLGPGPITATLSTHRRGPVSVSRVDLADRSHR